MIGAALMDAEMPSAKSFTGMVFARVKSKQEFWTRDDVYGWMREVLPRFGHPDYGWTVGDAFLLGDAFLEEASTW